MIVIETRENAKLKDVIPNCQAQSTRMDLCDGSVVSISYLSDAKMIKLYFKAAGLKQKQIDDYLNSVNMIQNDPMNVMKGTYYPVAVNAIADGYFSGMIQRRPDSWCNDMQTDGLLFHQNIKQSGLWKSQLLNVYLKEKIVFALDIFTSVSIEDLTNLSIWFCWLFHSSIHILILFKLQPHI